MFYLIMHRIKSVRLRSLQGFLAVFALNKNKTAHRAIGHKILVKAIKYFKGHDKFETNQR